MELNFSFVHLSAFKRRERTEVHIITFLIIKIHVAPSLKVFCFEDCYFLKVAYNVSDTVVIQCIVCFRVISG